jgi:hypothetical protein
MIQGHIQLIETRYPRFDTFMDSKSLNYDFFIPQRCQSKISYLIYIPGYSNIFYFLSWRKPDLNAIVSYYTPNMIFYSFCIYLPIYIIIAQPRGPHSLLYNGYRVSFPGVSGRSVALTTRTPLEQSLKKEKNHSYTLHLGLRGLF